MFKANLVLSTFFFLFFLHSCAQLNPRIRKAYAFSKLRLPGANKTDEQGHAVQQEIQTDYFLYLESADSSVLQIDSVLLGEQLFTVSVFRIHRFPEYVGKQRDKSEPVLLRPSNKNYLWKLELQPLAGNSKGKSYSSGEFVVKGRKNGRQFIVKIPSLVALEPEESY